MSNDALRYSKHVSIPKGGDCKLNGIATINGIDVSEEKITTSDPEYDLKIYTLKYNASSRGMILRFTTEFQNANGEKSAQNGNTAIVPPSFPQEIAL